MPRLSTSPAKLVHLKKGRYPYVVYYLDQSRREKSGRAKRVPKYFTELEDAEEYQKELASRIMQFGADGLYMDQVARAEYFAAKQALLDAGIAKTLPELAREEIARVAAARAQGQDVRGLLERFIEDQRTLAKSEKTILNLEARIRAWIDRDALSTVGDVTKEAARAILLRKGVSMTTRRNDLFAVSAFCAWLADHDYLEANPVANIQKPEVVRKPPYVWSANQAECILRAAQTVDGGRHLATVSVLLLAGLRPSELAESRVLLDEKPCVRVEGGKLKGRANRVVPLTPHAVCWLKAAKTLAVEPLHYYWKRQIEAKARARCAEKYPKEQPLRWVPDTPRHTYISHRMALLHDETTVAREAGTSPDIIFRHYFRIISDDEPKKLAKVLPNVTK